MKQGSEDRDNFDAPWGFSGMVSPQGLLLGPVFNAVPGQGLEGHKKTGSGRSFQERLREMVMEVFKKISERAF